MILKWFVLACALGVCSAEAAEWRVELHFESVRGLMLVRARMGDREGTFIFDTGAQMTLVDREFLGLKPEDKPFDGAAAPGARMTRTAEVAPACLGELCAAKATVGTADFGDVSKGLGRRIDGILGQDVLRKFDHVGIDFKKSVVTLVLKGN